MKKDTLSLVEQLIAKNHIQQRKRRFFKEANPVLATAKITDNAEMKLFRENVEHQREDAYKNMTHDEKIAAVNRLLLKKQAQIEALEEEYKMLLSELEKFQG
ncbi:MAG: hypothetical protein WCT49_02675 [Candidatus Paceibacterota bacterium]|jgi:hypothetical protein|nr:hypothetical protein [Candidatus Paceibacterota bacterium]